MPRPPNLTFADRLAPHAHPKKGKGHIFKCTRTGHSEFSTFIPGSKSEAIELRNAHDFAHHNSIYRHIGFQPVKTVTVDELAGEWLRHIRQLEVQKLRDPNTTRHYEYLCPLLVKGLKYVGARAVNDIDPSTLSRLIAWLREHMKKSGGAAIAAALRALKTMILWKGLPATWKIPHDEIRSRRREKKELDSETIRRLIEAMPIGSVEEAAAYLKARTGARDVEIYKSTPGEFDLELGVFAPTLHRKGRGAPKRHAYALTTDVVEKVRPFVDRARRRGGPVFIDPNTGRQMNGELMRPKIRAAAKKAGFVAMKKNARPRMDGGKRRYSYQIGAIDSIAQIRSEIVTVVADETSSLDTAQRHIGHEDVATTRRWYYKDKLTMRKLEEKRRTAEIIARAIPLRG